MKTIWSKSHVQNSISLEFSSTVMVDNKTVLSIANIQQLVKRFCFQPLQYVGIFMVEKCALES